MGRRLRVLRIDDVRSIPLYMDESDYSPDDGDGTVGSPLKLLTFVTDGKVCLRVGGLASAVQFWSAFRSDMTPDIVIADIDFEHDDSGPLKTWHQQAPHIPSGLSHIKPFAAIARASGSPIAIAMYTGDQERWNVLARKQNGDSYSDAAVFGLLAAHESIELAAILGDEIRRSHVSDFAPVWEWFRERTATDVKFAIAKAVGDYRRQVVERLRRGTRGTDPLALRAPLGAGVKLRAWCQDMEKNPRPLVAPNGDVGLPILFPDGRVDEISFASLFADVERILTRELPAKCFDLRKDSGSVWTLLNGLPRIGALIAELGCVENAAGSADTALTLLPLSGERLNRNLRDVEPESLARGLAVLFRTLEVERADETMWEQIWDSGDWDPVRLEEPQSKGTCSHAAPLSKWVDRTEAAVQKAVDDDDTGWATLGEITTCLREEFQNESGIDLENVLQPSAVAVHLEFLYQTERVERRPGVGGSEYKRRDPSQAHRPMRPTGQKTKLSWLSDHLSDVLMDSLGFGKKRGPGSTDNHNAVGQVLYQAFLANGDVTLNPSEQAEHGRAFLDAYLKGNAPGWIVEVCGEYCRTRLAWTNRATWPKSIKGREIGGPVDNAF
jgi:hypothetical protein